MIKNRILMAAMCLFFTSATQIPNISMQQIQLGGIPLGKEELAYFSNNQPKPTSTLWYIAGGTYIAAVLYVLHARYLLNNLSAWNNWKSSTPLSDLASMPQKSVYEMLSKSIEITYNCPPGTLTMNLTKFLQDTGSEIETLSNYVTCANGLRTLYIAPLFLVSVDSITQAEEKIKRLRFMQSTIASELEPTNCVRRLTLINYASQTYQSLMQRVLGRHH